MAAAPSDLISTTSVGAGKQEELAQVALDSLRKTIGLVWTTAHYPPGNKAITDAAAAWKDSINGVLSLRSTFILSLLKTRLYFEDTRLDTHDEMSTSFVEQLTARRIRKIVFMRGINETDLERFTPVMSMDVKELLREGGPVAVLKKQKAGHVEIVENEFAEINDEDLEGKSYWEQKLIKMGLDVEEIVDFLSGKKRLPRLLTDELRLLIEAMKDPRFFSQILMHIAMAESQSKNPPPSEVIRLCKRFEYILVANSVFDSKETPRILTRGLQAIEPKIRLQLLAEKLRMEAEGTDSLEDRLFGFSPDEYAMCLVRSFERSGDWRPAAASMFCNAAETEKLGQAFRARLMTSGAWSGDDAATDQEVTDFGTQLTSPLPSDKRAPAEGAVPQPDAKGAFETLNESAQTFFSDLEDGYVYTLLYMMGREKKHLEGLADRLIGMLGHRLEMESPADAARLLPLMLDPDMGEKRLTWFKSHLREKLDAPHVERLASYVASGLVAGGEMDLKGAHAVAEAFGEELRRAVLTAFFEETTDEPSDVLMEFLGGYEAELVPILRDYLKDENTMTRLRAIELLTAFDSKAARDLVVAGLDDADMHVRLVTLFALGRGTAAQGIGGLTKVADPRQKASMIEKCAAITSLGKLHQKHCVAMFGDIVSKRNWFSKTKGHEFKACAALALRDLGTPEAMEVLKKNIETLDLTRFGMIVHWISGRFAQIARAIVSAIKAVVAAIAAFFRGIGAAIRWVVLLPVRLVQGLVKAIGSLRGSRGGADEAGAEEPAGEE